MAWVYMLRGTTGRYYIGSTTELERCLQQHRRGHTHSTHRLGHPLELIESLEMPALEAARQLERELKRKKNPRLALFLLQGRRQAYLNNFCWSFHRDWSRNDGAGSVGRDLDRLIECREQAFRNTVIFNLVSPFESQIVPGAHSAEHPGRLAGVQ